LLSNILIPIPILILNLDLDLILILILIVVNRGFDVKIPLHSEGACSL
jgi:hypothetical protein